MNNPSIIKQRLSEFAYSIGKNKRQFTKDIGVSESFLVSKGGITEEKIINIISIFPQLNANWLLTGKGPMFLPESENLSENSENLSKQTISEERNISVDDKINELIAKKTLTMNDLLGVIKLMSDNWNSQIQMMNNTINGMQEHTNKQLEALVAANNNATEIMKNVLKAAQQLREDSGDIKKTARDIIEFNKKIG